MCPLLTLHALYVVASEGVGCGYLYLFRIEDQVRCRTCSLGFIPAKDNSTLAELSVTSFKASVLYHVIQKEYSLVCLTTYLTKLFYNPFPTALLK